MKPIKEFYKDPNDEREFTMYVHFEDVNFEAIPFPPKQSYGVVINDFNQMLVVANKSKNWILPGGELKQMKHRFKHSSAKYTKKQQLKYLKIVFNLFSIKKYMK